MRAGRGILTRDCDVAHESRFDLRGPSQGGDTRISFMRGVAIARKLSEPDSCSFLPARVRAWMIRARVTVDGLCGHATAQ